MKLHVWLFLGTLTVGPVFAQPEPIPRELARRFLAPNTSIYVGTLPPQPRVGFAFPLPPGVRVIGANASDVAATDFDFLALYLASARPANELGDFYREAFRKRGWLTSPPQQTGFLPSGAFVFAEALTFCRTQGRKNTDLYLTFTRRLGRTLIDAQLTTYPADENSSPCDQGEYNQTSLPELAAPADSSSGVLEYLSGFGPGNGASLIVLDTELGAGGVLEHYARQLEAAGWRERNQVTNVAAQTVTYRFRQRDRGFWGVLQVIPLAQPNRYLAQLTVVRP